MSMFKNKLWFKSRKFFLIVFALGIAAGLAALLTSTQADRQPSLGEKISSPGKYQGYTFPRYKGVTSSSFYLTMRDGVKIAIDLDLPKGLPEGEKIPTILYQTRYVRSLEYRWPINMFLRTPDEVKKTMRFLTAHGYAFVTVDVRGSAASYGTIRYPYSPGEVKDGAEIVDWIIRQPWSDGKVGSYGTSYTGISSEFLLVNNHPAVKAVVPRYAMFDAYADLAYPGGIHQTRFTERWAAGNLAIDNDTITDKFGLMVRLMVKGIKPVDEDKDRSLLKEAIKDHRNNVDVHKAALAYAFRDDIDSSGVTIGDFSPHSFLGKIEASGVPVYNYSGWYDGAYQHAAIKNYMTINNPKKLIIGPWSHGGRQGISPWGKSRDPEFNHDVELLRFFDYHLKGIENGIMQEKPVYYFTMGEEKWKWADAWPLPNQQTKTLYFSARNRLTEDRPTENLGRDTYVVDYSTGTGNTAGWDSLTECSKSNRFGYPDRTEQDRKLLYYTGAPLTEDMEVTGHPIVRLYVKSTADDGNFFVYLEDVDPSGHVTYVTEGSLRAIHRKLSDGKPPYKLAVPYRTFKRADARSLVPGEVAELVFDLLPTSYLYKKNHSVRVSLAGADKDHFALMKTNPPPTLEFQRTSVHPSSIDLPVIPR